MNKGERKVRLIFQTSVNHLSPPIATLSPSASGFLGPLLLHRQDHLAKQQTFPGLMALEQKDVQEKAPCKVLAKAKELSWLLVQFTGLSWQGKTGRCLTFWRHTWKIQGVEPGMPALEFQMGSHRWQTLDSPGLHQSSAIKWSDVLRRWGRAKDCALSNPQEAAHNSGYQKWWLYV